MSFYVFLFIYTTIFVIKLNFKKEHQSNNLIEKIWYSTNTNFPCPSGTWAFVHGHGQTASWLSNTPQFTVPSGLALWPEAPTLCRRDQTEAGSGWPGTCCRCFLRRPAFLSLPHAPGPPELRAAAAHSPALSKTCNSCFRGMPLKSQSNIKQNSYNSSSGKPDKLHLCPEIIF